MNLPSYIPKSRMEAFSDGVIAIIITIMVLEMKVPHGDDFTSLSPVIPVFLSYLLSFIYVGIYWNNHHHLLHAAKYINGKIMWANLHLLFWLSLIPFVTNWVGEHQNSALPTALYGCVLLFAAGAYTILQYFIVEDQGGKSSPLAMALGDGWKEKLSLASYLSAIFFAFTNSWVSDLLYIVVAMMWIIPDRRIEKMVLDKKG
jgi:uncharacterized membrane protein